MTNCPAVFSRGFQFQLGITDEASAPVVGGARATSNMAMLIPVLLEDDQVPPIVQQYRAETVFRLLKKEYVRPIKGAPTAPSTTEDKWHTLLRELRDMFEPTLLLFLRQVRCLVLEQMMSADARRRRRSRCDAASRLRPTYARSRSDTMGRPWRMELAARCTDSSSSKRKRSS